ncbi:hypothetical protein M569_10696 [Genlisea aurea]|uniref:Uncharacterized protein n=1 Tax=Genlisea aurea TaxID=192259 RepID=S8CHM4_9LAMI|nr:hypothetical protein M569_10696 [Genlisea aurea]
MADLQRPSLVERDIELAITALKKGAQLLKYGRRGKPKFCPFRLSTVHFASWQLLDFHVDMMDESALLWYYGKDEKRLELNLVSRIIPGQRTPVFQRYPRPEKEYQSFSLIYNDRSLDLICKDKDEAEAWFVGLKALISCGGYKRLRSEAKKDNSRPESPPCRSAASSSPSSSDQGIIPSRRLGKSFADILSYTAKNPPPVDSISITPLTQQPVENGNTRASGSDAIRLSLSSALSSSSQGSCAEDIDGLGDVFIWGEGTGEGLIGGGDIKLSRPSTAKSNALFPKALESTVVLDVKYIACGQKHAVLVTKQGDIFSWGEEMGGRLGHGVGEDLPHPKLIESLSGKCIETVSCGEYHTCAVTVSGELYTWGDGFMNCGVLGHGSEVSHWIPKMVCGPVDGLHVSSVSCGPWHTVLTTSTGQAFAFGDGTFGALGHGDRCGSCFPRVVERLKDLRTVSVACGVWHTAAIVQMSCESEKTEVPSIGKLFTWGDGDKGKLGSGDNETRLVPHCVSSSVDINFLKVVCADNLTVALTSTGRVYTMGSNDHGQLGIPLADGKTPVCVGGGLTDRFVEDISCGSSHVAILTSKGEVFTWGKGRNGQLGHGDTDDRSSPTRVDFLKDRQVKSIACGSNFTASVCVHKWTCTADTSLCSDCRNPFTFIRHRHNCYNCGLVFCNACSTKKSLKASLAPRPNKPYRVCDDCFAKLQKAAEGGGGGSSLNGMRKVKSGGVLYKQQQPDQFSRLSHSESFKSEKMSLKSDGGNECGGLFSVQTGGMQLRLSTSSVSPTSPRHPKNMVAFSVPNSRLVSRSPSPAQRNSKPAAVLSSAASFSFRTLEATSDDRRSSAYDEIKCLRTQVEELGKKLRFLEAELEGKQMQLQEVTERAADEARKNEAANEVIKQLTTQVRNLTTTTATTAAPLSDSHDYVTTTDRGGSNCCSITPAKTAGSGGNGQVQKSERILQDETGVYITLFSLPNGTNELRRVRFSRRQFTEEEAEKWWEENETRVCDKYNIRIP